MWWIKYVYLGKNAREYSMKKDQEAYDANHNMTEYTVSELTNSLKKTVEDAYGYVRVRGEISGLKKAPSGHVYLNLKDNESLLSAVCWKGVFERIKFAVEDGLEVIARGRVTIYPGQSKYQLVIDAIEPFGLGALMALLEKRKKKLASEGLFDIERKKPLPYFPKCIGVVTSPTGAVIQDILHRIEERFPTNVKIWPVLVQGDMAAEQIAAAIEGFNYIINKPDVIIVARGGGSLEDLWCFNEEIVVRAAANSKIPLVSAVGHETDTTLIDFAADKRAPTPTAAAEMVTPLRSELIRQISDLSDRLNISVFRIVEDSLTRLNSLFRLLGKPNRLLEEKIQRLDNLSFRLASALPSFLNEKEKKLKSLHIKDISSLIELQQLTLHSCIRRMYLAKDNLLILYTKKLETISRLLESYHYKKTLNRGFAIVKYNNMLIDSIEKLNNKDSYILELKDGEKEIKVIG